MIKVVLFTVVTLFIVGCSNDADKNANAEVKSKQEVKTAVAEIKEEAKAAASTVEEKTNTAVSEVKEEIKSVVSEVKEEAKAVVEEVKVIAQETKVATSEAIEEKKVEVQEAIAVATTVDVVSLYKVCAGCHGADGSKSALNKSQVIKGWDAKKISDALHGYKNGTYGGTMKGLMGAQVSKIGDVEIEALSIHISKF